MPDYSIAEFAELTNKKPKDIHAYAARGKVVKNSDKKISTTNPVNLAFFEKHRTNGIVPHSVTMPKGRKASNSKAQNEPVTKPVQSDHSKVLQRKTELEVAIKEKDLEAKEIELSKKRGELIGLQDTVNIISTHNQTFMKELDQNIQTYVQDICVRHGISSEHAGKYKLTVAEIINKANKKAVEQLKKQFDHE